MVLIWRKMNAYLSGAVLSGALGSGQLTLAVALGATVRRRGALGLGGSLGGTQHGTRDGGVDVSLLAGACIVRLQVLLLAWGALRAIQVVLSSKKLVMQD